MTKICRKCKIEKHISEFPKHKQHRDGHENACCECKKQRQSLLRRKRGIGPKEERYKIHGNNPIDWSTRTRKCKVCGIIKSIDGCFRKDKRHENTYHGKCLECENKINTKRIGLKRNPNYKPHNIGARKTWCNKICGDNCTYNGARKYPTREQCARWHWHYYMNYLVTPDAKLKRKRQRYIDVLKQQNILYHTDLNYKIKNLLRKRVNKVLRGESKSKRTIELLGCSLDYFMGYLERQFVDGMSWDNMGKGGWHIDHIRPCAMFDLRHESQQRECFHYTNMQPLWEKDNLSKGKRYFLGSGSKTA